jgi:hypothetical protein
MLPKFGTLVRAAVNRQRLAPSPTCLIVNTAAVSTKTFMVDFYLIFHLNQPTPIGICPID